MDSSHRYKALFFTAGFWGIFTLSQPVLSLPSVPAFAQSQMQSPVSAGAQEQLIDWPFNYINLSQLEAIFSQYPALKQLDIHFPNQTRWNISPGDLQRIASDYQQEASSLGVMGKLPALSFSAISASGLQEGLAHIAIGNPNGDIKAQMDDVLRQMRYEELNLSNALPDWLKHFILAIYDAVYSTFDFLGSELAELVTR